VMVEVEYAPQCPWVVTSLRVVRECVRELEEIAELKEVDVWRRPELMRRPTVFAVYINGKELPGLLGYVNKELIVEEIKRAAVLKEGGVEVKVEIKPLTIKNLSDEIDLCTKFHTYGIVPEMDVEKAVEVKRAWLLEVMKTFDPCAFIAYKGEEPYGFIEFLPYPIGRRISFQTKTASEETAIITCLLARQKAWRSGIASKLLQACMNNLKSRGFRKLEVKAYYKGRWHPVAFYEKHGFKTEQKLDEKSCLMIYYLK